MDAEASSREGFMRLLKKISESFLMNRLACR